MNDITDAEHRNKIERCQESAGDAAAGRNGIESPRGTTDGVQLSGGETNHVRRDRAQEYSRQKEQRATRDQRVQPMTKINARDPFVDRWINQRQKKNYQPRNQQKDDQLPVGGLARREPAAP